MAEPHIFVAFGGTGDLMRRKLLPAIFELERANEVGQRNPILAVARDPELDDEGYRRWAHEALEDHGATAEELDGWCDERLFYQSLGSDADGYAALARRIAKLESEFELPGNRLLYLAVPPKAFPAVIAGLSDAGLTSSAGWTRVVIEKPFGEDLESARELNTLVHRHLDESQVYRIDHYLGKETVQNLLVFRFANMVFEALWNRDRISSVQITVAETLGLGSRAGYYDKVGAVRDMLQNHIAQVLSLIAMEVPAAYNAESVRQEKIKLLRAVRPLTPNEVALGQYGTGEVGGEQVAGYLDEQGVPAGSRTPTYAACRLEIDNWRWQGVPFYLRTGKRLNRALTEIVVSFRRPPVSLFESMQCENVSHDVLIIRLQPDEGFSFEFDVKRPGWPLRLERVPLEFKYAEKFGALRDAYATLLLDVLLGDQTLFVHADEVEAAWKLVEPALTGELPVESYAAGSWGPRTADQLLWRYGQLWWQEQCD